MSLFDRFFPRLSSRSHPEAAKEVKSPFQPAANEPKDPIVEAIRTELNASRVIHTYGYEQELHDFAVYIGTRRDEPPAMKMPEPELLMEQELATRQPAANPNTMWAYGLAGATVGFAIAGVLMRKHVEPLTSVVFTSFAGIGGYVGSKLDQRGLLPPLDFIPSPSSAPTLPTRNHYT